jgi:dienelactone hydrolase
MSRSTKFDAGVVYHQSLFPDQRELETLHGRLLCHYGTNDHSTPKEEVDAFTRVLDRYDKEYEVQWYDGMQHSFAQIAPDATVPGPQREASDLSHRRSYEFLWRELGHASTSERPEARVDLVEASGEI